MSASIYHLGETNQKALELIEDVTADAEQVQGRDSAEILSRSAYVDYQCDGLEGRTNIKTFKKVILDRDAYVDYQRDGLAGSTNHKTFKKVMARNAYVASSPSSNPNNELLKSSGTPGGDMKPIPIIEEQQESRSNVGTVAEVENVVRTARNSTG